MVARRSRQVTINSSSDQLLIANVPGAALAFFRAHHRVRSWRGPASLVEQMPARRSHDWAQALEWYALPKSWRQTLETPIPPSLPLEVAFPKQAPQDEI
jgi:hypothetical protein